MPAALHETHWIAIAETPRQFPRDRDHWYRGAMVLGFLDQRHILGLGFLERWCANVVCGGCRRRIRSQRASGSGYPRQVDRVSSTGVGRRICSETIVPSTNVTHRRCDALRIDVFMWHCVLGRGCVRRHLEDQCLCLATLSSLQHSKKW